MNTGTPESSYGYWYPGEENDGASGWAVIPEKYGPMWIRKSQGRGAWCYDGEIELGYGSALRSAATIVADDPLFGLIAYGGKLIEGDDGFDVTPCDELRKRLHVIDDANRVHIELDRDGFKSGVPVHVSGDRRRVAFTLENRTGDEHSVLLRLAGLPLGNYQITLDDVPETNLIIKDDRLTTIELPIPCEGASVVIEPTGID
jgi:hypothetical protein